MTNLVKLIRWGGRAPEVHCYATPIYNPVKCRLMDEFSVHETKFTFFFYEIHIFGFPCCSTREDLSINVSITNVGLILTKLW